MLNLHVCSPSELILSIYLSLQTTHISAGLSVLVKIGITVHNPSGYTALCGSLMCVLMHEVVTAVMDTAY